MERFRAERFPALAERYRSLVDEGQRPDTLFIGCSDSRVDPGRITDTEPGELFVARNAGNFVPPFDPDGGEHATAAAIEYAVAILEVGHIIVCGHSHCGAIRALYEPPEAPAPNIARWLGLGPEPLDDAAPTPEVLRRTERRSIRLQLERLRTYPVVRDRLERGTLELHGWHYIIEDGRVIHLDAERDDFVSAPAAG